MSKAYKITAKNIVQEAKREADSPDETASKEDWIAYSLKKYDESRESEISQGTIDMRLMDVLVAELFGTFDEESLNYIIDYLYKNNFREDRINLNYKLTKDQAAIIGKILSQRFPSSQREYIINKLVEAKNTKRPPVRFYKKPSMKKCPICNSTKFRVTLVPLGNENVSEKVCENCSYKHIITKEELSLNS